MATGIQKARMMMATAIIFPTPSGLRNKRATPTEAHTPSFKAQDAEAAMQVRGRAGEHQVDGAKVALGHAYGGGSQYFSMCLLGAEKP